MNIKETPTKELEDDLTETQKDIVVCEKAMKIGILSYSGNSVMDRLDTNLKIEKKIMNELRKRGD